MAQTSPLAFARAHERQLMLAASFGLLLFTLLFNLTHSPLWGDEWEELVISGKSLTNGEMYGSILGTFQPPLYNFVYHFWLLVSHDMLWMRLFNVPLGLLCGVLVQRSVSRLANERVACVAVAALACTYEWVYCMQECSEYALMLTFLFVALHFLVALCEDFTNGRLAGFVLGCAGAMYSQYGAAFVVLPSIVALPWLAWRLGGARALKRTGVAYAIAFALFVIPLYVFYLRHQLGNLGGDAERPALTPEMLLAAPGMLGRIVAHFLHLPAGGAWDVAWNVCGVALLTALVWAVRSRDLSAATRSLAAIALAAYVLHYPLVRLHVYAMVHPGQSYGFFCRYSYFYLPILAMALPPVLIALAEAARPRVPTRATSALALVGVAALAFSFVQVLPNWHKSFDDEFAHLWVGHEGWKDRTYLLGAHAEDGWQTYVPREAGYEDAWAADLTTSVDVPDVPERFWVWHCNWDWSYEGYEELVDYANAHGYQAQTLFRHDDPLDPNNYYVLALYERI